MRKKTRKLEYGEARSRFLRHSDKYAAIFAHVLLAVELVCISLPFDTGLNQIECATLSETERKKTKDEARKKKKKDTMYKIYMYNVCSWPRSK